MLKKKLLKKKSKLSNYEYFVSSRIDIFPWYAYMYTYTHIYTQNIFSMPSENFILW